MKAGDLKYRITINQPTYPGGVGFQQDSYGQPIIDDNNPLRTATIWAAKWNLSTKDVTRQAGLAEQATGKFLVRRNAALHYFPEITTDMTLTFEGKTFRIVGTEDVEDNVGLFLFVRSLDGQL